MKLASEFQGVFMVAECWCRRSMFFLTAIGVYAFLKLLAEVDMLLLFLLYYYAGGCVGLGFNFV